MCQRNSACVASYFTLIELSVQSGHVLSDKAVLTMTADTEYTTFANDDRVHPMMKEGMARQYWETYDACKGQGHGRCSQNNKIQMFMAGFEAFFDPDISPSQRARFILKRSGEAIPSNKEIVAMDIGEILDPDIASMNTWDLGAWMDRPWQWRNMPYPAQAGQALISPYVGGSYLWIVSFNQNIALNSK